MSANCRRAEANARADPPRTCSKSWRDCSATAANLRLGRRFALLSDASHRNPGQHTVLEQFADGWIPHFCGRRFRHPGDEGVRKSGLAINLLQRSGGPHRVLPADGPKGMEPDSRFGAPGTFKPCQKRDRARRRTLVLHVSTQFPIGYDCRDIQSLADPTPPWRKGLSSAHQAFDSALAAVSLRYRRLYLLIPGETGGPNAVECVFRGRADVPLRL